MPKGWRTADLLPIKKEYDVVNNRMKDTGNWDWAVPNAISGLADIPDQINELGSHQLGTEYTDKDIGSLLNLSGFGVSPMRFAGTTLTTKALPAAAKADRLGGVIGELGKNTIPKSAPGGGVSVPNPERFAYKPQEGFYMGPFANKENMPGVSLATAPQAIQRVIHGTGSSNIWDKPKIGSKYDEAFHVTTDPTLSDVYSNVRYMDPIDPNPVPTVNYMGPRGRGKAPRSVPMLLNPGPKVAELGELQGQYPWRANHDYSSPSAKQQFTDAYYAGEINEEMYNALLARADNESLKGYMKDEGISSMRYEHEPMGPKWNPHESYAVTSPKGILTELSPEGQVASKWNEVEPFQPALDDANRMRWDEENMFRLSPDDAGIQKRMNALGWDDATMQAQRDADSAAKLNFKNMSKEEQDKLLAQLGITR